ncbi:hypothetical protein L7E55_06105 [Pelotomaculum isophthalicicum JI]|uniref:LppX_LprAFG lipoprotein n=1 Tax=Pelotomaculum isophthalicicum JI TaxID=947010 RepID=A0A9X4H5V0_9FIRM|nr:hypothetical protein [Pelotomaculum isophthalicicum]MDF9407934.1 hypothetical protein [Pelotomaculum isophthalicicum JI]
MRRPCWVVLNKKISFIFLAVIFILLIFFLASMTIKSRGAGKAPPREMFKIGLERTIASESFRYQTETKLITTGKANINFYSKVEGERAAPDQVQMKGTIMNTPVDFIQVGDSSYFRDQPSGRWVSLPGNKLSDMEIFYAELNPLAYFNFKDIPDLKYKGIVKVNGERLLQMEIRPILMDPFLELRLTDFSYMIWLSPEDYRIKQALIQAKEKNSPQSGIEINLSFWDYDKNISIVPPDVN